MRTRSERYLPEHGFERPVENGGPDRPARTRVPSMSNSSRRLCSHSLDPNSSANWPTRGHYAVAYHRLPSVTDCEHADHPRSHHVPRRSGRPWPTISPRCATCTCATCSPKTRTGPTSMTVEAADLVLDYSKNRLTAETVRLLVAVAERAGLHERTEAMFSGEHINVTEDRAVLHVALRAPEGRRSTRAGTTWCPMSTRSWTRWPLSPRTSAAGSGGGLPGKRIKNIINIGIGGSDLGPGHGLRGAVAVTRTEPELAVCLQRRRGRHLGGHGRHRPGRDAFRRQLEDFHDLGDDRQRQDGQGMVARQPG